MGQHIELGTFLVYKEMVTDSALLDLISDSQKQFSELINAKLKSALGKKGFTISDCTEDRAKSITCDGVITYFIDDIAICCHSVNPEIEFNDNSIRCEIKFKEL